MRVVRGAFLRSGDRTNVSEKQLVSTVLQNNESVIR